MTQKQRLDHYKTLINNTGLCSSLNSNYPSVYDELMTLFQNHPEYPKKIEDVIDIAIIKNRINPKYFELQLIKSNGIIDNISYIVCINKPSKYKFLKEAMRYAILSQILEFKNNQERIECVICKSQEDIHIDHLILFQDLFTEFIKTRNDIPLKFDNNYFNGAQFKPDDAIFETDWKEFHKRKAILRCLCKKCNLTRKKK